MGTTEKGFKRKAGLLLIFLCWLVYACSYIGKVNYAANINQIMSFYAVDHSSAGLVSTLFFFAYGIGQVVNGLLCKKYNIKWFVFGSLIVSGTVNFIVGVTTNFTLIKFLWLLNGFSMSVLWPCLIRLLSETLNKNDMAKASVIMGTTVATGTLFVYALSALFVRINFKILFYLPAGLFFVAAVAWSLSYSPLVRQAKNESEVEQTQEQEVDENTKEAHKNGLLLTIIMLAFYGVATNLIKDGLTTWVPSILKEEYQLDNSISIILTLALPIVAIFANAFAVRMHNKIKDFILQCATMFLIAGIIIGCVIGGMSLNLFWITLLGFTLVCFLVSSCNSVITSIFPLFMRGKVNSGRIAGLLNGFCYLGSTISSYGLGTIADCFGWLAVFWVLLGVCVLVCLGAIIYLMITRVAHGKKNLGSKSI